MEGDTKNQFSCFVTNSHWDLDIDFDWDIAKNFTAHDL